MQKFLPLLLLLLNMTFSPNASAIWRVEEATNDFEALIAQANPYPGVCSLSFKDPYTGEATERFISGTLIAQNDTNWILSINNISHNWEPFEATFLDSPKQTESHERTGYTFSSHLFECVDQYVEAHIPYALYALKNSHPLPDFVKPHPLLPLANDPSAINTCLVAGFGEMGILSQSPWTNYSNRYKSDRHYLWDRKAAARIKVQWNPNERLYWQEFDPATMGEGLPIEEDIGGPLLDKDGQVIALTCATPWSLERGPLLQHWASHSDTVIARVMRWWNGWSYGEKMAAAHFAPITANVLTWVQEKTQSVPKRE